jgi:hypothetical protein
MSPPTEQLIRDFLNRLSVAARGQLGPDDRRALVQRTRDFIDRKTGLSGPPTAQEVGTLLFGLGDPATLVQQERRRLAAVRGDMPEPPAERNLITRALRRDSGKRRASWHWPVMASSRADLQLALLAADSGVNGGEGRSNGTAPDSDAGDDDAPYVPAQAGDPDWFFQALGDESQSARETVDQPPDAGAEEMADSDEAGSDEATPTSASRTWTLTVPDPQVFRRLSRALAATAVWYRQRPLEASAVVLLGLGGGIYPPVWLLGAAVALASRVWDGTDKWLGLALPPLLTIIAAALGVTVGGHVSVGHGMHDGWVFGVAASRAVAVLSAAYLGWRSVHGRRPPTVPPWNRPHKVG